MKIAVVGCGALGSFYGARLCRDGHDTHFLLRSDYDVVRRRGVRILSPEGDFVVRPKVAKDPAEIGPVDWVIIGLKTTANGEFARLLTPLVGPKTAILTLQNGLGNEEALARIFPVRQILGGLCFVCLNRIEPGVIQHLAHGKIIMGELSGWPEPRTHDLASAWRHCGVSCSVTAHLAQVHWEKLVWNIPFNGLGVASCAGWDALRNGSEGPLQPVGPCLPTDRLLADPDWSQEVRDLMSEVIAAANALGHPIPRDYGDVEIQRTREMGSYRASTLIDFERGQELELDSLFLEPLRQARQAGVAVPRLEALARVLTELARSRSAPQAG